MNFRSLLLVGAALAAAPWIGCKESPPQLGTGTTPSASALASDEKVAQPPIKANVSAEPPPEKFPLNEDQIAKIVNPSGATEYTGPTGVIEGVIKVKGPAAAMKSFVPLPRGCEKAVAVAGPAYRAGEGGTLADALVGVIGVSGYVRPSKDDKVVTIKDCMITPRAIDLSLGQRLMIANEDPMPYMPQVATRQVVRRLAIQKMSPVPVFLTAPGVYGLTWLAGMLPGSDVPDVIVFVLPNALHQVTNLDGKFRITGVPVGKATVTASHRAMGEAHKDVEVKAGAATSVEIVLNYTPPPSASASASGSAAKPKSSIH